MRYASFCLLITLLLGQYSPACSQQLTRNNQRTTVSQSVPVAPPDHEQVLKHQTAVGKQGRADDPLAFDPNRKFTENTLTYLDGKTVNYRAYENLYYVANVVDSTYQHLNIYIPESAYAANSQTPIFFRTYVGGYFSSKAQAPSNTDASGRALQEGYVLVIPGARGWNAKVTKPDGSTVSTGKAPAGIVDLKAAIRYLRHNDARMPGNAERIITDGTSAGGAMSSLLGTTGNHPAYEPYLQALGAAKARDDIFAAVAYCPIVDLDHADMAYEWLYSGVNSTVRSLSSAQAGVSTELAAQFPAYQRSLGLKMPNGAPPYGRYLSGLYQILPDQISAESQGRRCGYTDQCGRETEHGISWLAGRDCAGY